MTEHNSPPDGANGSDAPSTEAESEAGATQAQGQQLAELKDKFLRTLAELENLRRRAEREVSDARAYGVSSFARDLLAVADNLERALETAGAELRADPNASSFVEGVELTQRELLKVLEKHGVQRFDPAGQRFDPNLHQAMYEVVDAEKPSGTVAEVMQAGFKIGERVLRPALVAVARGGPKPSPAPQAGAGSEGPEASASSAKSS